MYIGVYLCLTGFALLLGPLISKKVRIGLGIYILAASLASLAGLVAFEVLSVALGVIRLGEPMTYSYPQDYLARGPLAWLVMLLPIFGLLSPLFLALFWPRSRFDI